MMITLRRSKLYGKFLPGCWESPLVKMERIGKDKWECHVPLRQIGCANFYEFRSANLGGVWTNIGTYPSKQDCCVIAERVHSGEYVVEGHHYAGNGLVPRKVVAWKDVANQIDATSSYITPPQP